MNQLHLHWRGRHGAVNLWPFQSVNRPLGRHRILVVARGKLDASSVFRPWRLQVEVMQLQHCCGRGRREQIRRGVEAGLIPPVWAQEAEENGLLGPAE